MTAVIGRRKTESGEPSFMVEKVFKKLITNEIHLVAHRDNLGVICSLLFHIVM